MILQQAQQLSEDEHPQALRGLQQGQKKPLEQLLRKAQQGKARRDEEKAKVKAKAMAEFLQPLRDEPQGPRGPQHPGAGLATRTWHRHCPPRQGRADPNSPWQGTRVPSAGHKDTGSRHRSTLSRSRSSP